MSSETTSGLQPKAPEHDRRTCRFLRPNPGFDRSSIAEGADRARLPLFLCTAKDPPLMSTMVKCKYCRENGLLYEPRPEGTDSKIDGHGS